MTDRARLLKRGAAEFLVIVTGILAAFWVDEFREARAAAVLEQEYIVRLASDLDDALENLTKGAEWARERGYAGRAALAHLSGSEPLPPELVMLAAYEVTLTPIGRERRLGRRTTFDELVTTGNLVTIRDARLRASLARYYEEYNRVGGRIEDWPEDWRAWVQRGLSPDVLMRLEGAEEIRDCFSDAGIRGDCRVDLPLDDQRRFMRRLDADRAYARGELNRIVHYQDRQFSDLREFMEATVVVRAALGRADLER